MIDRFNFYDVYGYLLPGAAVFLAIATPFLLVGRWHLSAEFSSALVIGVLAYFAGHLLQLLTREILPSQEWKDGRWRYPSDFMLDASDPTLPASVKRDVIAAIRREFGIDASATENRDGAFQTCRQYLQGSGVPSYAEQYQGLYALLRGLSFACFFGAAFSIGWIAGLLVNRPSVVGLLAGLLAVLVLWELLKNQPWLSLSDDRRVAQRRAAHISFGLVVSTLALVAATVGPASTAAMHPIWRLSAAAALFVVGHRLFLQGNRQFIRYFARTVYIAFHQRIRKPEPQLTIERWY